MHRRTSLKILGGVTLLGGLGATGRANAAETIKIGTLFPKSSPWGKVCETWTKAVNEKSGGQLELQFFYNGQQGDDDAMVGKIKAGQLDGALVSGQGLGKIYRPILALQMPGLFTTWSKLDKARDAMKAEFEKGARDAGFFLAGWGDVGLVRWMSKGFALRLPDALKGKKPYFGRADALDPAVLSVIGGVTGTPLSTPEVLPNLNTGAINALRAPALFTEQLQWSGKLDNLNAAATAVAICATAFSSKRVDALPPDLKTILTDTGKVAMSALTTKIRNEDDAAYGRLKGKMTVTAPTAEEAAKWDAIYKQARQKLSQGTFSPELVTKLEGFAK